MKDIDKLKIIKSLNSANIFIDGAINKHLKAETFLDLESHSLSCINIVKKTEPVESKDESTSSTVEKCEHIYGFQDTGCYEGGDLVHENDHEYSLDYHEKFAYCPLCGVKL